MVVKENSEGVRHCDFDVAVRSPYVDVSFLYLVCESVNAMGGFREYNIDKLYFFVNRTIKEDNKLHYEVEIELRQQDRLPTKARGDDTSPTKALAEAQMNFIRIKSMDHPFNP